MANSLHYSISPFRKPVDPARTFTPLGRPFRKPRKIAVSLSSLASSNNIDDFYFLEKPQLKPDTHINLRELTYSRLPLHLKSEGPSPCTYTLPQPPRCTLGGKINPRTMYDRDNPAKPNYEVWTLNTRTLEKTPSPCSYAITNGLGEKSPSKKTGAAYSMRGRHPPKKTGMSLYPAPNHYNTAQSADYVSRHFPQFSMGIPNNKKRKESSPGPAHYHPKHSFCQNNSPSFTFTAGTTLSTAAQ